MRPGGQIRVVMTDQDVIRRLQSLTGLGLVHNRGRRTAHHKTVWEWAVTRRENVCTPGRRVGIVAAYAAPDSDRVHHAHGRPIGTASSYPATRNG